MGGVSGTGALRAHLIEARLAGTLATPREKSLARYRLFAARDPRVLLGLDPVGEWPVTEVARLMARVCGAPADPPDARGPNVIDPDRTLAALGRFADRIAAAARRRAPVLLGTGHPQGLLEFYAALADGLAAAGCAVLTPGRGLPAALTAGCGVRTYVLDYVRGVALMRGTGVGGASGKGRVHTHSPLPVRLALAAAAEGGGPLPELVIGDHGWICGAGELGFEAIGLADADDPGPFVGEAEGRVCAVVPLDDAVAAAHYRPLWRYVLNRAELPC
ncbi:phosphatase [Streptomyces sp. NPDC002067]